MSAPQAAPVLVLQHIGCEPPAAYEEVLDDLGIALDRVHVAEGARLPDWRSYRAIVAMGGPMGTYEEGRHRWLGEEKRLIAEAVRHGTPFWGVCLGAQLLAASLGARVMAGPEPEIGVLPVQLTAQAMQDPVFGGAPARFRAFQWHGDTYELPAGAVRLAGSELYEQQAFVFARAYALQFHLEVTAALVAEWARVPAYAQGLERLAGSNPLPALLAEVAEAEAQATALARDLFGRWLAHVARLPGLEAAAARR